MRISYLVALVAVVVPSYSCGNSTEPTTGVEGVYSLRTVNGSPLPFILDQLGPDKAELTASSLTILPGGDYSLTGTLELTINGRVSPEPPYAETGTWTQRYSMITLTPSRGRRLFATASGNILTVPSIFPALDRGASYEYQR
jgi:hypothetical protein